LIVKPLNINIKYRMSKAFLVYLVAALSILLRAGGADRRANLFRNENDSLFWATAYRMDFSLNVATLICADRKQIACSRRTSG
jgi:hypothetical protein